MKIILPIAFCYSIFLFIFIISFVPFMVIHISVNTTIIPSRMFLNLTAVVAYLSRQWVQHSIFPAWYSCICRHIQHFWSFRQKLDFFNDSLQILTSSVSHINSYVEVKSRGYPDKYYTKICRIVWQFCFHIFWTDLPRLVRQS